MEKIKRCKVCGKRLNFDKAKRYEITKYPAGFQGLTEAPKTFEAFDCEKCGCQNIVNIREV